MKKIDTLKKNYEFKNVLQKGEFYYGRQILCYIRKNRQNRNFLGIAVGTKIAKAVKRNRLKRLIRENYRLVQDKLEKGYDIVFLWNKKVEPNKADFFVIQEDMKRIFEKAKLLKEEK